MRDQGNDFFGSVRHDGVGGFHKRAARVRHVVNNDGDFIFDVADENHSRDFAGPGTFFVDEGELEVEAVGD